MESYSINILGTTNREQWHSVINMLRTYNYDGKDGFESLCKELDRYIDWAESIIDILRKEN